MTKNNTLILRLIIAISVWLLVYYSSIIDMIGVWSNSKTYEHGFLIVPIALWLVWHEKERFNADAISSTWIPVVLLLLPSLLWLVGKTAGIALFEHVAAVFSLQLIIWAVIGNKLAKAFYFPIFYLFFCIPFGEELVPALQVITADISVLAVQLSGIPIYREGLFLSIPNGQFEVAEACSGIRFLISSIALGTLFAYMFFHKWWKILLFVGFSCLFPIIANGLRAYGIIIIGYLSDMKYATGADHLIYGWFFFAVVILFIFYIASSFSDKAPVAPEQTSGYDEPPSNSSAIVTLLSLSAVLLITSFWERSITSSEYLISTPITLPGQAVEIDASLWGISYPKAQKSVRATTADGKAELFSAMYSLTQRDGELIGYENQLYDKNHWTFHAQKRIELNPAPGTSIQATYLDVVNSRGNLMKILYWYCINDYCSNSKIKLKLKKATWLISGNNGTAGVHALASPELSEDELAKLAINWLSIRSGRE